MERTGKKRSNVVGSGDRVPDSQENATEGQCNP
jgi:hypothetical protein